MPLAVWKILPTWRTLCHLNKFVARVNAWWLKWLPYNILAPTAVISVLNARVGKRKVPVHERKWNIMLYLLNGMRLTHLCMEDFWCGQCVLNASFEQCGQGNRKGHIDCEHKVMLMTPTFYHATIDYLVSILCAHYEYDPSRIYSLTALRIMRLSKIVFFSGVSWSQIMWLWSLAVTPKNLIKCAALFEELHNFLLCWLHTEMLFSLQCMKHKFYHYTQSSVSLLSKMAWRISLLLKSKIEMENLVV